MAQAELPDRHSSRIVWVGQRVRVTQPLSSAMHSSSLNSRVVADRQTTGRQVERVRNQLCEFLLTTLVSN